MILDLTDLLLLSSFGLVTVTLIDVLGSISSRRLNYRYVYLTPVSFMAYSLIGYLGYQITPLMWTLLIVCMVGIYDGTIGWKLSIILKANFGDKEEHIKNLSIFSRVTGMLILSGVFGLLGYFVAGLTVRNL
jgi:hypothetical protein